ncbi:MAG: hypothetical protein ACRDKS_06045 [Actinomycetota bacterium]
MQQNGSRPSDDADGLATMGEIVWIPETLVVSPARGRFRREPLTEGSVITAGTVIGNVSVNGHSTPVASAVAGVFLGWMAWEGEMLKGGTPLARIGSDPSMSGAEPSPNSSRSVAKKDRRRPDAGKDR